MTAIPPGSTIGIIGGGQLGRMSAIAAAEMGYRTHIFTPDHHAPAIHVATSSTVAPYTDSAALQSFTSRVDVITFEFENIPHSTAKHLAQHVPVRPSWEVLHLSQNRLREKNFIRSLGIQTTPYERITSLDELVQARDMLNTPAVLKTTELGYDGKGQQKIDAETPLEQVWENLGTQEAIYEAFVDFTKELSIIVARRAGTDETIAYPAVENIHKNHILHRTFAPADVDTGICKKARDIAITIANGLALEGLLAIELFLTKDGQLLVNEMAPRPHNSGHWSQDGCVTSQFEQHIRAVCGLPLGSTDILAPTEMLNLLGKDVDHWHQHLAQNPRAKLHLYGKTHAREGRKMGHVNVMKE